MVLFDHETVCLNCGIVIISSSWEFVKGFNENISTNYFSKCTKQSDSFNYFKRRLRCIMEKQKIQIKSKLLENIKEEFENKNIEYNEITIKEYLKKKISKALF